MKFLRILLPVSALLAALVLVFCQKPLAAATLGGAGLLLGLIAFWEGGRVGAGELLSVSALAALAAAGRILFAPIPQFQPATAVVILAGCLYGARAGAMTGVLLAFLSNLALGQGGWTLWQMLAWGAVGAISALFRKAPRPVLCLWSMVAAFLFSLIVDGWTLTFAAPSSLSGALAILGAGLLANIPHAVGNPIFVALLQRPFSSLFARLKDKYRRENV